MFLLLVHVTSLAAVTHQQKSVLTGT